MVRIATPVEAEPIIAKYLIGCSINRVSNHVTGWDIRVISPESNGPELSIFASEIEIPQMEAWRAAFASMPLDILDTNEPDDVITAAVLFSVLNKWPIEGAEILDSSDLKLIFGNKTQVLLKANVELVDWTWQIVRDDGSVVVTCDSGALNLSD